MHLYKLRERDVQNIFYIFGYLPIQKYSCSFSFFPFSKFFRYLKAGHLENGVTGQVSFNMEGDRLNPVYNIMNVQQTRTVAVGIYGSRKVSECFSFSYQICNSVYLSHRDSIRSLLLQSKYAGVKSQKNN